jgi:hypothetical protein
MKSFRTSPSSSAAVPRAVLTDGLPFDRHHLWLAAGALLAFLGSALTTVTLVAPRHAACGARTARIVEHHELARGAWVTSDHHTARWVIESGGVVVHAAPRVFRW